MSDNYVERIEAVLESADALLASINDCVHSPSNPRSSIHRQDGFDASVSPEVQSQIDNMDRNLRSLSTLRQPEDSGVVQIIDETESVENAIETDVIQIDDNSAFGVDVENENYVPSRRRARIATPIPTYRLRNCPQSGPIDFIDLCDSPSYNNENAGISQAHALVNLVSPAFPRSKRLTKRALQFDASTEEIQNIKKTSNEVKELKCPICMEDYRNHHPTTTKCGHVYCEKCINQAVQITPKCPTCRTKLNRKSLIRIHI